MHGSDKFRTGEVYFRGSEESMAARPSSVQSLPGKLEAGSRCASIGDERVIWATGMLRNWPVPRKKHTNSLLKTSLVKKHTK